MAKKLLLMRHAKSSWDDPDLDDHDRPLNKRGRRASKAMSGLVERESLPIDLILCSTSVRTRETIERVFADAHRRPKVQFVADLYGATPQTITRSLNSVESSIQSVLVVAHNPGLEDLLARITGEQRHFPTAALASIDLDCDRWDQFDSQTRGRLNHLWLPRELDNV